MTYSALAIAQASTVRALTSSTGKPWSAPATPSSSAPLGRIMYVKPEPAIIVQAGGTPMLIVIGIGSFRYQWVATMSMWEPGEIWKLE